MGPGLLSLVLLASTVVSCLAQSAGKPPQIVTELKTQYRQTALVTEGHGHALIVIPAGDAYQRMAQRVREVIQKATGAALPIKLHDAVTDDDLAGHIILLGNMDNNSLGERLYWQRYLACDLDYPGREGRVIRTICDPWGTGANVIVLGGSNSEGVERAVEAFLPRIEPGKDLVLPLLLDIELAGMESLTPEVIEADWKYYRAKFLDAKKLWYGCAGRVSHLAHNYYLTGNEEYARMYNLVLKRWMEEYYTYNRPMQLDYPKYQMPDMFLAWDLIEESPHLTDELRLEMTNLLYDYTIGMGRGPRVRDWQPGTMRLTGHVPLLSVVYGARYFKKHYPHLPMEDIDVAMGNIRTAIETYKLTDGFMSETGYVNYHPNLIAYYARATGDLDWYANGNALRWEEYCTLCTDNGGSFMSGWYPTHLMAARYYGDGRWLWLSNFMRHSDDYELRIENGKLRGVPWAGRPDLKPVPPLEFTGLRCFRMRHNWYKELARVRGELGVPQQKAFHQAVMRVDFDRLSQYARIPGVNIGFHYGTPANCFASLSDKGRGYLVNGRWGMSLMKYYNTVLVIRDGQASPKLPYLCSLETECDLPQTGFLQSKLPDYNGTDWLRSVVWNKQRYWLVFDSVRPREPADYTVLCQWRTAARPTVESGRAVFGRTEPALVIETTGAPSLAVSAEGPAHGAPSSHIYRQGRHGALKPGDEARFCNLLWAKGGTANIEGWKRWQSSADTALLDGDNPHAGASSLRLVCTGRSWRCLNTNLPPLEPGARYRVIGHARTNGKVGAAVELRDLTADPQHRIVAKAHVKQQEWTRFEFEFVGLPEGHTAQLWLLHTTYKAAGGEAWFDDLQVVRADEPDTNLLTNGDFETAGDIRRMTAQYAIRGLPDGCAIVNSGDEYWIAGASGNATIRDFNPASGISIRARAFNIAADRFALAGGTALSWNGPLFSSDTPVSIELDSSKGEGVVEAPEDTIISLAGIARNLLIDGKPVRLSAGEDGTARVAIPAGRHTLKFSATPSDHRAERGRAIWAKAQPPAAATAADLPSEELQVAWEWKPDGENVRVNVVKACDLDGDRKPETIVGLSDGSTVILSSTGAELSRHKAKAAINDVACVDLDGDGEAEVLSASDDFNVYATDLRGGERWVFCSEGIEITNKLAGELGAGYYASSEGEFITLKIADLDGDGRNEILAGAKAWMHGNRRVYGTVFALSLEGKLLWHVFNFGGTPLSLDCADIDGDGKLEIAIGSGGGTYGRNAYLVNSRGQLIARYGGPYGEKFTALARLRTGGPMAFVRVERTDGTVWVNSAAKETTGWWTYPTSGLGTTAPVVTDLNGDGAQEVLIGGESGDLYLLADSAQEHLVWRTNLHAAITALRVVTIGDAQRILAGASGGRICVLDAEGRPQAAALLNSDVLCMDASSEGRLAVVGLEDTRVVALTL